MRLQIEYDNSQFLDVDFNNELYITGSNRNTLWEIYRSLFYYKQRLSNDSSSIYGENGIEIKFNEEILSHKHNVFHFINSREDIYQQLTYQKNTMLFNWLLEIQNKPIIANQLEKMNDELYRLTFYLQKQLTNIANNIQIDLQDFNYLDILKHNLHLEYVESSKTLPLNFMSTDNLMDEYLNLLQNNLQNNPNNIWLIMYNLESYLSPNKIQAVIKIIKNFIQKYNLKIIYITNTLDYLPLKLDDIANLIIINQEITQLPPFDIMKNSIGKYYPNDITLSDSQLLMSIKKVAPLLGSKENVYLRDQDMVILKIMDKLLGVETSTTWTLDTLTYAETEFLKDN